MVVRRRAFWACLLMIAGSCSFGSVSVSAQGPALGGYGGLTSMAPDGMGASGLVIPYGGGLSGFMPYRMVRGGTGLSFSARNSSTIGSDRSSFRLSSMSRGMSMSSASFGESLFRRRSGSLFSRAMVGGMTGTMGTGSQGVMPPNFGYPFYQPPSLLAPSSALMGMSSM
jgi:hypothetical protein